MLRELGHDLSPLETVRATILSHVEPLPVETRALSAAAGAVLREDLVAHEQVPPFDNSAMDGFAVRAADVEGASEERPVTLPVVAITAAGNPGAARLAPGEAIRIMTGAPLPAGAESVVPHEITRFDGRTVTFFRPARSGQNVRRAGGDLEIGDVPLSAGTVLSGPQLAIAASLGRSRLRVTRAARVAILSPGDELVEPGAPCGPGKIRSSNAYALAAAVRGLGLEPIDLGIVRDTREDVLAAIHRGIEAGADALVSSGGVSAGDYDFVQRVVREEGKPGYVFKVAMRPGKPQAFGLIGARPVFGLPGNPAAAVISFEVLVRPALRRLRGETEVVDAPFGVRFPFPYRYKPGRVFLLRTRLEPDPEHGGFRVAPPGDQDSSFLASLARANAIVFLPADRDAVEAGEMRPAVWLGGRP